MTPRVQNALVRALTGVLICWVGWDALRAVAGTLLALVVAPPSERALPATIFLLAYGLIPALAMAGCAALACGLVAKYPDRNHARSLALLSVSVGFFFGTFFLPTLVGELDRFGVNLLPGGADAGEDLGGLVFGLVAGLSPAWFYWFSASFPDEWRNYEGKRPTVVLIAKVQRFLFGSPIVLLVGIVPVAIIGTLDGWLSAVVAIGSIGIGLGSLWLTHLVTGQPVAGRSRVVIGSLCMPVVPFLLWPLAELVPHETPFFAFDIFVLSTAVALCAMVFGLAYAVFVQGVVGPALVLRSGFLLGGAGVLAVFLFSGLENLLTDVVVSRIGLPGHFGTFVSAGVLAVIITTGREKLRASRKSRPAS